MSNDHAFYILPVTGGGYCAEPRSSILQTHPVQKRDEQGWVFEPDETATKVAFRNRASGQYLRAQNGNDYGNVGLGSKQWWGIHRSNNVPNGFYIKCLDYGEKAVLCNGYGYSETKGNKIFMWQSNIEGWGNRMVFYFVDAVNWANAFSTPLTIGEIQHAGGAVDDADSKKRDEEIKQKLAELESGRKDLESREKALADSRNQLQTSQEDFQSKEKAFADDRSKLEKSQQDLDASQKAVAERQRLLEEREKAVAKKGEKGSSGKDAAKQLEEMHRQLESVQAENEKLKKAEHGEGNAAKKAEDLERQLADLQAQNEQLKKAAQTSGDAGTQVADLQRQLADLQTQNEQLKRPGQNAGNASAQVADLQRRLADLQTQNEQLRRTSGTSTAAPSTSSNPQPPGNTATQDADNFLQRIQTEMSRPLSSPTPSSVPRGPGQTVTQDADAFDQRIREELSRPPNLQQRIPPPVVDPRQSPSGAHLQQRIPPPVVDPRPSSDEAKPLFRTQPPQRPPEFDVRPETFGKRPRVFEERAMGHLELQESFSLLPRLV